MLKILLRWIVLTGAVLAASYLVPGIGVPTFLTALLVALVLGLINISLKPILKLITLPINIITLGIFGIILNAFFFWLASVVVPGFTIAGFIPALIGSLVVSVITWILNLFIK